MTLFTRHDCFKKGRRSSIVPSGVTRARKRAREERTRRIVDGGRSKKCAKRVETRRRRRVRISLRPHRLEDTAVARKKKGRSRGVVDCFIGSD